MVNESLTMNAFLSFLIGLSFSIMLCCANGLQENTPYWGQGTMDLEALPLKKLLEMKKEIRIKGKKSIIYSIYDYTYKNK